MVEYWKEKGEVIVWIAPAIVEQEILQVQAHQGKRRSVVRWVYISVYSIKSYCILFQLQFQYDRKRDIITWSVRWYCVAKDIASLKMLQHGSSFSVSQFHHLSSTTNNSSSRSKIGKKERHWAMVVQTACCWTMNCRRGTTSHKSRVLWQGQIHFSHVRRQLGRACPWLYLTTKLSRPMSACAFMSPLIYCNAVLTAFTTLQSTLAIVS